MATVYVTYGKVGKRGENGVTATFIAGTTRSETITSSGTSAKGTLTANDGDFVQIVCATTVAAVVGDDSGGTLTATLETGAVAFAGVPQFMSAQAGHKTAVIDA